MHFFHGWRRKAGVVTPVMASVIMGGWIRSLIIQDQIILVFSEHYHVLVSAKGNLRLFTMRDSNAPFSQWSNGKFTDMPDGNFLLRETLPVGQVVMIHDGRTDWVVPYGSIVSPLPCSPPT